MTIKNRIDCELVVIGAGMAGMAATLFAANRGVETLQVGTASEIIFASGLLDLLGVHPVAAGTTWENPWTGLEALCLDQPNHPYAKIKPSDIYDAFEELTIFLKDSGLPYQRRDKKNSRMLTSVGTLKHSYYIPQTMWNGNQAFEEKQPCLIFDIKGLRGFSARQITETVASSWPDLSYAQVSFSETSQRNEIYTESIARALALPQNREALADLMNPLVRNVAVVGMPAIFGIHNTKQIQSDLEARIGVPMFEIPTIPPSIPGIRLKETFEENLPQKGVSLLYQKQVLRVHQKNQDFILEIGDAAPEFEARTKGVILASGRFLGKGLHAGRKGIKESIFDLPVCQPKRRSDWHRHHFLEPSGHPINQAGIETDALFRPINKDKKPAYKNLFAAGSILAHQDWMRQKCGSGLAVSTAYAAVNAFLTA